MAIDSNQTAAFCLEIFKGQPGHSHQSEAAAIDLRMALCKEEEVGPC